MDLSKYRGNLYKQTLSPSWSKSKLKEAKRKFDKVPEDRTKSSFDSLSRLSSQNFSKPNQQHLMMTGRESFMSA